MSFKRNELLWVTVPGAPRKLSARLVRESRITGGLTVRLQEQFGAYNLGDELNVTPAEVALADTRREIMRQRRIRGAKLNQEAQERRAAAAAIVATGKCPQCQRPLRRNASIKGWWQCSQLGAVGFRADPEQPSCNFQCWTD